VQETLNITRWQPAAVPLDATAPGCTARIATQFTGQLRDFVWSATAYYQHVNQNCHDI